MGTAELLASSLKAQRMSDAPCSGTRIELQVPQKRHSIGKCYPSFQQQDCRSHVNFHKDLTIKAENLFASKSF
jgi:hypothetical protein